jgi:hypothetical protein
LFPVPVPVYAQGDIGERLKKAGIIPWLDEWNLRPGDSWIKVLEKQIDTIKAAIVFIGPEGIGPWQDMEIRGFLLKLAEKKCRIIPVILQGCKEKPDIPLFLETVVRVDFHKTKPDPFHRLLFGITGKHQGK